MNTCLSFPLPSVNTFCHFSFYHYVSLIFTSIYTCLKCPLSIISTANRLSCLLLSIPVSHSYFYQYLHLIPTSIGTHLSFLLLGKWLNENLSLICFYCYFSLISTALSLLLPVSHFYFNQYLSLISTAISTSLIATATKDLSPFS